MRSAFRRGLGGRIRNTLLLVDDYPLTLRAWTKWTKHTAFRVVTASTVDEARVAIDVHRHDLAGGIFDIMLGSASSLPVIAHARDMVPRAVLVVLSAYVDRYAAELARCGVFALEKPTADGQAPIRLLLRKIAAGGAWGLAEAVEHVAHYKSLATTQTRVIAALARGIPRARLSVELGIPEGTIEHWICAAGGDSAALLQLVLRVFHEGPQILMDDLVAPVGQ